jgi:hypothetical protein
MTINQNPWSLSKVGPIIVWSTEETVVTLQCSWTQAGDSSCVVTRWDVDDQMICQRYTGTHESWGEYWQRFLNLLPEQHQAAVAHSEQSVRF